MRRLLSRRSWRGTTLSQAARQEPRVMLRRSGYLLLEQDPVTLSHGTWEGYVTAARPLRKSMAQIQPEGRRRWTPAQSATFALLRRGARFPRLYEGAPHQHPVPETRDTRR